MLGRSIPLVFCFVALVGCSSAGPPHGPKYVPEASEESATECPEERSRAQAAREAVLGESDVKLQMAAAKAVYEHGRCEESTAAGLPIPTGSAEEVVAGLSALRTQTQSALNLYKELRHSADPALRIRSLVGEGRLQAHFSKVVASVDSPPELQGAERVEFASELQSAALVLREEAIAALEEALVLAGTVEEVTESRKQACRLLEQIGKPNHHCQ